MTPPPPAPPRERDEEGERGVGWIFRVKRFPEVKDCGEVCKFLIIYLSIFLRNSFLFFKLCSLIVLKESFTKSRLSSQNVRCDFSHLSPQWSKMCFPAKFYQHFLDGPQHYTTIKYNWFGEVKPKAKACTCTNHILFCSPWYGHNRTVKQLFSALVFN